MALIPASILAPCWAIAAAALPAYRTVRALQTPSWRTQECATCGVYWALCATFLLAMGPLSFVAVAVQSCLTMLLCCLYLQEVQLVVLLVLVHPKSDVLGLLTQFLLSRVGCIASSTEPLKSVHGDHTSHKAADKENATARPTTLPSEYSDVGSKPILDLPEPERETPCSHSPDIANFPQLECEMARPLCGKEDPRSPEQSATELVPTPTERFGKGKNCSQETTLKSVSWSESSATQQNASLPTGQAASLDPSEAHEDQHAFDPAVFSEASACSEPINSLAFTLESSLALSVESSFQFSLESSLASQSPEPDCETSPNRFPQSWYMSQPVTDATESDVAISLSDDAIDATPMEETILSEKTLSPMLVQSGTDANVPAVPLSSVADKQMELTLLPEKVLLPALVQTDQDADISGVAVSQAVGPLDETLQRHAGMGAFLGEQSSSDEEDAASLECHARALLEMPPSSGDELGPPPGKYVEDNKWHSNSMKCKFDFPVVDMEVRDDSNWWSQSMKYKFDFPAVDADTLRFPGAEATIRKFAIGQVVEVLRSSGSWSAGKVSAVESQQIVTVVLHDGRIKRITDAQMSVRVPTNLEASSWRPAAGLTMLSPRVHELHDQLKEELTCCIVEPTPQGDGRLISPETSLQSSLVAEAEDHSSCSSNSLVDEHNAHEPLFAATEATSTKLAVAQVVEVLRSSGSWTPGKITVVESQQVVQVVLDDGRIKKVTNAQTSVRLPAKQAEHHSSRSSSTSCGDDPKGKMPQGSASGKSKKGASNGAVPAALHESDSLDRTLRQGVSNTTLPIASSESGESERLHRAKCIGSKRTLRKVASDNTVPVVSSESEIQCRPDRLDSNRLCREVNAVKAAREEQKAKLDAMKAARGVRRAAPIKQISQQLAAEPTSVCAAESDESDSVSVSSNSPQRDEVQASTPPKTRSPSLVEGTSKASPPRRVQSNKTLRGIEEINAAREARRANAEGKRQSKQDLVEQGVNPDQVCFAELLQEWRLQHQPEDRGLHHHSSGGRMQVCLRKRPLNARERGAGALDLVTATSTGEVVMHELGRKVDRSVMLQNWRFNFDAVFDDLVKNEEVFDATARNLVDAVVKEGADATMFAYGQTGSGKTFSMNGAGDLRLLETGAASEPGMYQLSAAHLFEQLDQLPGDPPKAIVSFIEVYGVKVRDLLQGQKEVKMLEDARGHTRILGAREKEVTSAAGLCAVIAQGSQARSSKKMLQNAESSRSHAVLSVQLFSRRSGRPCGRFSLIDLAGNERGADNQAASSVARQESADINKSLLALKECIRTLARGRADDHAPFRQSKITTLLRESLLSPRARVCVINCVSPGSTSSEYTLNTLRYAAMLKSV